MGYEQNPSKRPEALKSFDMMASVDMLRFDMHVYGEVLPETRQRVHDEEMSLMAEGVGRVMRRPDTLLRKDGRLVYFNQGEWQPYMSMLVTGLAAAKHEATQDYRKQFLHDRAQEDYAIGLQMEQLEPGERMMWVSRYPAEIEQHYGARFLKEQCGMVPERRMGFIYTATGNEDGSVTLESQTIDNSDDEAFAAVMRVQDYDGDYDLDTLVRSYDGVMMQKHGGRFYAGRRGAHPQENVWHELLSNKDLVSYYMYELESLAASTLPRHELELRTKQLTIGVWKTFRKRLDGEVAFEGTPMHAKPAYDGMSYAIQHALLTQQVAAGYREARALGEVKPGCGGGVRAAESIDDGDIDGRATFDSIFGPDDERFANKGEEKYSFDKKMFCVVCQAPPKSKEESKKMCGPCGICKGCDTKIRTKSKGSYALAA